MCHKSNWKKLFFKFETTLYTNLLHLHLESSVGPTIVLRATQGHISSLYSPRSAVVVNPACDMILKTRSGLRFLQFNGGLKEMLLISGFKNLKKKNLKILKIKKI